MRHAYGPKTVKRFAKSIRTAAKKHGHVLKTAESQGMASLLMTGRPWQATVAVAKSNGAVKKNLLDGLRLYVEEMVDGLLVLAALGRIQGKAVIRDEVSRRAKLCCQSLGTLDRVKVYALIHEDRYELCDAAGYIPEHKGRQFFEHSYGTEHLSKEECLHSFVLISYLKCYANILIDQACVKYRMFSENNSVGQICDMFGFRGKHNALQGVGKHYIDHNRVKLDFFISHAAPYIYQNKDWEIFKQIGLDRRCRPEPVCGDQFKIVPKDN